MRMLTPDPRALAACLENSNSTAPLPPQVRPTPSSTLNSSPAFSEVSPAHVHYQGLQNTHLAPCLTCLYLYLFSLNTRVCAESQPARF